jgi:hypothetical protein
MSRQRLSLNILSSSDIRDLSVRDPAGRIRVSALPCQIVPRVIWVSRPGRYLLPSGFTLIRITKLFTNPFPLFYYYQILNFRFWVLIWDVRQKKLESVFPQRPTERWIKDHLWTTPPSIRNHQMMELCYLNCLEALVAAWQRFYKQESRSNATFTWI